MAWISPKDVVVEMVPNPTGSSNYSMMATELPQPIDYSDRHYTEETVKELCDRLMTGESVRSICQTWDSKVRPGRTSVYYWLATKPEFKARYDGAKAAGIEAVVEEMFDIADYGRNDWMLRLAYAGSHPSWEAVGEHINRSRLRVDVRWRYVGQIAFKKYGQKQQLEVSGSLGDIQKLNAGRARVAAAKQKAIAPKNPAGV